MIGKILAYSLLAVIYTSNAFCQIKQTREDIQFNKRVLLSGLQDPWDVVYGPDHYLWITEAKGYTVSRIDIHTGKKNQVLDLNHDRKFGGKPWPQGGLMGMAVHPQLLSGKPFVYLAYVHRFIETKPDMGGNFFQTKIVRYTWDPESQILSKPKVICDTIPGSNDHNGGRLEIANLDGNAYLFYTTGDMGAGQFDNGNRPNHAQDVNYYEGKILRFNTEEDQDNDPSEKWIPDTNPFKNAVWSFGHRNPQGIAAASLNGKFHLYSTEHGPYSDDEVNVIEKGANYGHPLIIGYTDGNYNGLAAGVSDHEVLPGKWNTSYPPISSEAANAKKLGNSYHDQLKAFSPNDHNFLAALFNSVIKNTAKPEWSSEAPSSIAVYTADAIPGWKKSLLIPTLKTGKLIRLKLNKAGTGSEGSEKIYLKSGNRFRDVAISPDGRKLYLITDRSAVTSGPTKEDPQSSTEKGALIEFTYSGD